MGVRIARVVDFPNSPSQSPCAAAQQELPTDYE